MNATTHRPAPSAVDTLPLGRVLRPTPAAAPRAVIRRLGFAAAALLAHTAATAAVNVPIVNPSFEDPVQADGSFSTSATGWTKVGGATDAGVLNPTVTDFPAEAPDGQNVGYIFGGPADGGLAQVLTGALGSFLADAGYTLTVKVGNAAPTNYDGYRMQLWAGGTLLTEDDNSLTPPASGTFATATLNYTYNAGLHASLVGQPLEIRLLSKDLSAGDNGETEFDDVKLTVALANPLAVAGGPYPVFIGGSLLLNGSASLPSDGATIADPAGYEWDLNPADNGGLFNADLTGATPAAIPEATLISTYGMKLGGNTIRLKVMDSAAKIAIAEATVNILPETALVYEPFAYVGTALNGQSGTTEIGLSGTWTANASATLSANLGFGPLVTRGAGIGNLSGGSNNFGGARPVSAAALKDNGLLNDGATLWFSVIMGYDTGGNLTNSRLAFCLANNQFSGSNFTYNILNDGPTVGSGLGVTLGRFNIPNATNGVVAATQFTNSGSGFAGNVFGSLPSSAFLTAGGQSLLVVGKITWGAASDTIELYRPGADLVLPATPFSTLTVNVDQSTYDTITWTRGDRVVMDEIRFGASYSAVVESGYSWDRNGTELGSGGPTPSGNWNAGDTNWNVAPDGTLTPVEWPNGGVAVFSAGTDAIDEYTIAVNGTRDISGIVFEDGTPTVNGGTALRLTANSTVTVNAGRTATMATPLSENATGRELSKGGNGLLVLTADNSGLTGTTSLNAGVTRFDSPSTIPGTARNLFLNTNGTALFGPAFDAAKIPTAMANRIAAASTGTIAADNYASADFDFDAAGLTTASLGAVGDVAYSGNLTPSSATYRLGGGGGTLTLAGANRLTGSNALVVGGTGTVVLADANDYTGVTTVSNGAILRILGPTSTSAVNVNQIGGVVEVGHNDALGTGTLTFGGGFGTAPTIRPIGAVVLPNPVNANGFNIGGTGTLTFGNTFTIVNNVIINNENITNPTTYAAITASGGSRTLTFSGNGSSVVTGVIGGGTGIGNVAKNGNGTLTLKDVNTYTGTMAVNNAGTLLVVAPGSLPAGAVTINNTAILAGDGSIGGNVTVTATANIAPGNNGVGPLPITGNLTVSAMAGSTGTLRYQLGPIANSDKITVGGTLAIGANVFGFNDFVFTNVGGLENGTYKLITTSAPISGTLQATNLSGPIGPPENGITGTLQISDGGTGNDIELVVTGVPAGSAYTNWAATNAPSGDPDDDFDGDGVPNAVEFVLGGLATTNDLGKLPVPATTPGGDMTFTFQRAQSSIDPKTALSIEVSTDLATWNTPPSPYAVPDGAAANTPGVTVVKDTSPGFDTVTLTVPGAPDAKKFARLKVEITLN